MAATSSHGADHKHMHESDNAVAPPTPAPREESFANADTERSVRKKRVGRVKWIWLVLPVLLVAGGFAFWQNRQRSGDASGAAGAPSPASVASGVPSGAASGAAAAGARRFGGANRVQPVSVEAVQRRDIRIMVNAIGTMTAANTATVRPLVGGMLQGLNFKEGQQVKAGQLLAQIDPRSFQAALNQAEGAAARDKAQLDNAKIDVTRYRDLFAKDAIAKQQLDTQEAQVRQLEGSLRSDQATVDNARLQLSYTRVTAPIAGRVGFKQADLGNVVQPGDVNGIVSITQTRPIALIFAVPSAQLPRVAARLRANQPLEVEAFDRTGNTRLAAGRVATTDNAIDPGTDTIKLKALFPNDNDALYPNQSVSVRLQLDTLEDTLAVPQAAVLRGAQGFYVYVVAPDNSVSTRVIKPGAVDGEWTSVQGPLRVGENVVVDGADRLRDGAKVEVIATDPKLRAGANVPPDGGGRRRGPRGAASGAAGSASAPAFPGGSGASGGPSGSRRLGGDATQPRGAASTAAANKQASNTSDDASSAADRPPGDRPRLPPEVIEKLRNMQPEERRAYIAKLREERARRSGGVSNAPAN